MFCLLFKAIIRDGFRCVISGQYDVTSVQRSKELELRLRRDADASACQCYSECAHIFLESTNAKISGNNVTDKVYSFPIYLDVLLKNLSPPGRSFILYGQSWNVLETRRLSTS